MTDTLSHRGPDGERVVCRAGVGLGHRRLAIIDLVTGDQPMGNDDGSVWITFNGEIYNFRLLRAELEARGARFRTTSDTEVILRAWEAWGAGCVHRLRGMFAFAILDERRREVFLARDRVGIKPLFYAWEGERLLFGSELKALLAVPGFRRDVDWQAVHEYLIYGYVPAPRTIVRAARKLPPASTLCLSLDGGEPRLDRYWALDFAPDESVTEAQWRDQLLATLDESVRLHMISDVPVGAFLSGGIDSSTVVALMARASTASVRTFSIGFEEADYDELRHARQVAARYGTEHYEMVVKPDALEALPQLAFAFDEPFADSSALPTYYVSKITREHVTVALSGDGGDENFAGYRRYARAVALGERLDTGAGRLARGVLAGVAGLLPTGLRGRGYLELLGAAPDERYFHLVALQPPALAARLLAPEAAMAGAHDRPWAFMREAVGYGNAVDHVTRLQRLDVRTYLPEDILTKVDRASMLPSLETRVPLLDHVVMELAARMPSRLKLHNGAGKHILKSAVGDLLPQSILARPKMGFGVPLDRWFRADLASYVRDLLLSRAARQRGVIRPAAVERLLEQHQGGRNAGATLWALLMLEQWFLTWGDRSS